MNDVKRYDYKAAYGSAAMSWVQSLKLELERAKEQNEALLARIASLEREKEEARDKALEEVEGLAFEIASDFALKGGDYWSFKHTGAFAVGEAIRAMKGTKP